MNIQSIALSLLTCFCMAATPMLSRAQNSNEKEIRASLNSQILDWNKGDLTAFMKGYWNNDSLMFVGKSGPTYGYRQTLANYQKNYPDQAARGILSFHILKVERLSPEYYFVLGKFMLKRSIGDASGHFTLLYRKIRGQWLIVCDHSS
ncbi:MAG: nuclear transport factor 2 family protein [Bacteroidota bacterium]|nr:nuclear transport factor 2 family protein [Bacteroidota bacterium]